MIIKTLIATILLAAVVPSTPHSPPQPIQVPASPDCKVVYIDGEPDHCVPQPAENQG